MWDVGWWMWDVGLRMVDVEWRMWDCGLRIADCGLRIADFGLCMINLVTHRLARVLFSDASGYEMNSPVMGINHVYPGLRNCSAYAS